MGMNIYLVYLATILSTSGFNTYNYIQNKRRQLQSKKRNLVFKKNLSSKTKTYSKMGDVFPSVVYLGSTILSFIPLINVCVPELTSRLYYGLGIDDAIDDYYKTLNNAEITKRYSNGLTLKLMEECGYDVPEELKKEEVNTTGIEICDEVKEEIDNKIKTLYSLIYPNNEKEGNIDDLVMLSDKEFKKRLTKSLKLTLESDIDVDKVNRISEL